MNLGKNIRTLRRLRGWNQEDISKRLDISIPAFSKIETGVTDINLSRMEQIAAIFEISVIQLLTFNEDNPTEPSAPLDTVFKKLITREAEVIDLQKKVIQLFEELMTARRAYSPLAQTAGASS